MYQRICVGSRKLFCKFITLNLDKHTVLPSHVVRMAGLRISCVLLFALLVVCSIPASVWAVEYTFANSTIVAFVTNVNTGGYPEVGIMYPQVNSKYN